MSKLNILFALAGLFCAFDANAQNARPKADCIKVCVGEKEMNWLFRPAHLARMKKIQDARRDATDPAHLAALQKEEAEELERYADKVQDVCENICRNNPP
ncbi:hypothetical protein [Pseudoduganella sp.]|uniref:hypothetical protein n=1 Tax=Pseudoduganella sp. TaxID=1880898 RepID=UPI0035B2F7E1